MNNTALFRWVNCYDRVPTITKYYSVRNWMTGQDGATVYCDSNESLVKYCDIKNIDLPEMQWLEEYIPKVQEEATSHSVKDVEGEMYSVIHEEIMLARIETKNIFKQPLNEKSIEDKIDTKLADLVDKIYEKLAAQSSPI